MNLSELIPIIAEKRDTSIETTSKVVDELFEIIEENVEEGKVVRIGSLVSFLIEIIKKESAIIRLPTKYKLYQQVRFQFLKQEQDLKKKSNK